MNGAQLFSPFWRLCRSPTAFLSSSTRTFRDTVLWGRPALWGGSEGPARTVGGSEGPARAVRCSAASLASTWASLVAQTVKNPPAMRGETKVRSLRQEDPLDKEMATHSWRIPETEEPGGLQSMGSQSQP